MPSSLQADDERRSELSQQEQVGAGGALCGLAGHSTLLAPQGPQKVGLYKPSLH